MAVNQTLDAALCQRELMAVAWDALLVIHCPTRRIVDANEAACRLYGVTREGLLGTDFGKLFTRDHFVDDILAQHRDYVPLRFQRTGDARHLPVEMSFRYFASDEGECAAVAVRDISERMERDRSDSESERKYQSLFEASPYPVVILNAQGAIVDANRCALTYYGYDYEEFVRLDWQALDASIRPSHFTVRPTMFGAREHARKDGSCFMAETMFSYFRLRGQAMILALIRDVTEHWRTFRQLQESEARWRFAIEGSGDAMIDWPLTPDGSHVVSPVLSEMLGYSPADDGTLDAQGWMSRIHPDDRADVEAALGAHLKGGEPLVQVEYRLREHAGGYRWMALRAKVIRFGNDYGRLIGAVRDIDEARRRRLQEVAEQGRMFRLERLATAGEMLSALAHEVNQPLTAISNYGSLAIRQFSQQAGTESINRSLAAISEQALRAGEIVRRIREFVRRAEPNYQRAGINALVSRVAGWLHNEATAAGVAIRLELDLGLPEIDLDILQIEQVLLNLLRNGIEAMQATPGALVVHTSAAGEGVHVAVRDHGCGIDEALAREMFEPFVSSKSAGMGMGLAICRTVIDNHGGRIWAEPAGPGGGAVFHVVIGDRTPRNPGKGGGDAGH